MKKLLLRMLLLFTLLSLLVGCTSETSHSVKPTQPDTPETGKATVIGRVIDRNTNQPMKSVKVWMAEVVREGDQGAYVWDTTNGPASPTDDQGFFAIQNIKAMEYVIIVGEPYSRFEVISGNDAKPKVWNVPANEIIDAGDLVIDITSNK